jgi:cytochrome c oxidase subunit III
MGHAHSSGDKYYVPHGSGWPIVGCLGLIMLGGGGSAWLNGSNLGMYITLGGLAVTVYMMFGWFGAQIRESLSGLYNAQVDRTYRWGMSWFIFSEVMFFAAFFGALYYARQYSVPWLGGERVSTHLLLWPEFEAAWPTSGPAGAAFTGMGPFGLPLINTILLVTSGWTLTRSHHALKEGCRQGTILWLLATVVLGFVFLGCQVYEYMHAYGELNLKLTSGIYGSTFFMLTGFHGFHVTMGAIMLSVILIRCIKGHFTPEKHFAYEAVAWYWHFVDYVWLALYVFVYWL